MIERPKTAKWEKIASIVLIGLSLIAGPLNHFGRDDSPTKLQEFTVTRGATTATILFRTTTPTIGIVEVIDVNGNVLNTVMSSGVHKIEHTITIEKITSPTITIRLKLLLPSGGILKTAAMELKRSDSGKKERSLPPLPPIHSFSRPAKAGGQQIFTINPLVRLKDLQTLVLTRRKPSNTIDFSDTIKVRCYWSDNLSMLITQRPGDFLESAGTLRRPEDEKVFRFLFQTALARLPEKVRWVWLDGTMEHLTPSQSAALLRMTIRTNGAAEQIIQRLSKVENSRARTMLLPLATDLPSTFENWPTDAQRSLENLIKDKDEDVAYKGNLWKAAFTGNEQIRRGLFDGVARNYRNPYVAVELGGPASIIDIYLAHLLSQPMKGLFEPFLALLPYTAIMSDGQRELLLLAARRVLLSQRDMETLVTFINSTEDSTIRSAPLIALACQRRLPTGLFSKVGIGNPKPMDAWLFGLLPTLEIPRSLQAWSNEALNPYSLVTASVISRFRLGDEEAGKALLKLARPHIQKLKHLSGPDIGKQLLATIKTQARKSEQKALLVGLLKIALEDGEFSWFTVTEAGKEIAPLLTKR